jgi:branched-chain amino acid transport system substrate-binding protein
MTQSNKVVRHVTTRARTFRVILIILSMALCALSARGNAQSFTVGVSLPLTGDIAAYGHAVRNGLMMSSQEWPTSSVQMRFEDNRYDARESLAAYRKLVSQHKVDFLFSWGETPLQSIAPLIERGRVPTLAMSLDPVPAYGKKWIVVSVNHPSDFIKVLREQLRQRGVRSVGIVLTEDPFSQALYQEFAASALPGEKVEVIGSVAPGETDLRSLTLKASRGNYDAIGVYLLSGQIRRFYREAARIGFSPVTFGYDGFESKEEVTASGRAMINAIYPNIAIPEDFARRYVETFKRNDHISFAYNAYIIGQWIHSKFGAVGSAGNPRPDADSIRKALMTASFNGGAALSESPQQSMHMAFPLVIKEIVEGGFRDIQLSRRPDASDALAGKHS